MTYYLNHGAHGPAGSTRFSFADWGRRAPLVIQSAQVAETNSQFPILLTRENLPTEMIDAGANSALSGGGDIRFTEDLNGFIPLAADIVEFVPNAAAASRFITIWVRSPVDAGADKTIYVWYANAGATLPAADDPNWGPKACWQAGDIRGVYHMNVNYLYGSEGTDGTQRGNDMTPFNGPTNAAGSWAGGRALEFDGVNQYMMLANPALDLQFSDQLTILGRALTDVSAGWAVIISRQFGAGVVDSYQFGINSIPEHACQMNSQPRAVTPATATWFSQHAVKNANTYERVLLDGAQIANIGTPGSPLNQDANDVLIGAGDNGSPSITEFWDGKIGHVRIENSVRTNNYVLTHHNTMAAPASFVVPGTPVTP